MHFWSFVHSTVDDFVDNQILLIRAFEARCNFRGRITPVALIGDDEAEGMNGDGDLFSIFNDALIAKIEDGVSTKKLNRHSLDGRDVDESVFGRRVDEV